MVINVLYRKTFTHLFATVLSLFIYFVFKQVKDESPTLHKVAIVKSINNNTFFQIISGKFSYTII